MTLDSCIAFNFLCLFAWSLRPLIFVRHLFLCRIVPQVGVCQSPPETVATLPTLPMLVALESWQPCIVYSILLYLFDSDRCDSDSSGIDLVVVGVQLRTGKKCSVYPTENSRKGFVLTMVLVFSTNGAIAGFLV